MARTQKSELELLESPMVVNIIQLTDKFQHPKNRGEKNIDRIKGLENIHYRRALEKNFKYPKNYVQKKEEIESFFGKKLEECYNKGIIKPCLEQKKNKKTTNTSLSILLRKLVDNDILERTKVKKPNIRLYRYVLKDKKHTLGEIALSFNMLNMESFLKKIEKEKERLPYCDDKILVFSQEGRINEGLSNNSEFQQILREIKKSLKKVDCLTQDITSCGGGFSKSKRGFMVPEWSNTTIILNTVSHPP